MKSLQIIVVTMLFSIVLRAQTTTTSISSKRLRTVENGVTVTDKQVPIKIVIANEQLTIYCNGCSMEEVCPINATSYMKNEQGEKYIAYSISSAVWRLAIVYSDMVYLYIKDSKDFYMLSELSIYRSTQQ